MIIPYKQDPISKELLPYPVFYCLPDKYDPIKQDDHSINWAEINIRYNHTVIMEVSCLLFINPEFGPLILPSPSPKRLPWFAWLKNQHERRYSQMNINDQDNPINEGPCDEQGNLVEEKNYPGIEFTFNYYLKKDKNGNVTKEWLLYKLFKKYVPDPVELSNHTKPTPDDSIKIIEYKLMGLPESYLRIFLFEDELQKEMFVKDLIKKLVCLPDETIFLQITKNDIEYTQKQIQFNRWAFKLYCEEWLQLIGGEQSLP